MIIPPKPKFVTLDPNDPLFAGLEMACPMDEGGGKTVRDLLRRRHTVAANTVLSGTDWVQNAQGPAINFAGAQQVRMAPTLLPGEDSGTEWTVALTLKASAQNGVVFSIRSSSTFTGLLLLQVANNLAGSVSGDKLRAAWIQTSSSVQRVSLSDNPVADGTLKSVVVVGSRAQDKLLIYFDGVEQTITTDNAGAWPKPGMSLALTYLGRLATAGSPLFFTGEMGSAYFWYRALSPVEIGDYFADPWRQRSFAVVPPPVPSDGSWYYRNIVANPLRIGG